MYIGSVVSRFLKLITIKTIGACGSELWSTTDRYRNQCNSQVKFITIPHYNCIGLKAPVLGVDAVYCSCDWFYCNSLPEIAPRAGFYRWSQLMSTLFSTCDSVRLMTATDIDEICFWTVWFSAIIHRFVQNNHKYKPCNLMITGTVFYWNITFCTQYRYQPITSFYLTFRKIII